MTHTPGPWHVKAGQSCQHVVSKDGYFSTGCISFDGQSRANAQLIAAAPDLLAELKTLHRILLGGMQEDYDEMVVALGRARRAIAAAEGA